MKKKLLVTTPWAHRPWISETVGTDHSNWFQPKVVHTEPRCLWSLRTIGSPLWESSFDFHFTLSSARKIFLLVLKKIWRIHFTLKTLVWASSSSRIAKCLTYTSLKDDESASDRMLFSTSFLSLRQSWPTKRTYNECHPVLLWTLLSAVSN